jgi:hypothetical protein
MGKRDELSTPRVDLGGGGALSDHVQAVACEYAAMFSAENIGAAY